jgi:hypothetical protein
VSVSANPHAGAQYNPWSTVVQEIIVDDKKKRDCPAAQMA